MEIACSQGIEYSGISHIGTVREENQDTIRLSGDEQSPEGGLLFALADGMGGYDHGRIASQSAIEAFFQVYYSQYSAGKKFSAAKAMQKGVEAANLAVCTEARNLGAQRMGTTLTAVSIMGKKLYLAHVGDSRAYLVRGKQATCLTTDHSVVGDLLRMHVLTPDQVRTHARRSILTKALGLNLFVQADFAQVDLQENDRIILCSDGAWSLIEDEEFAILSSEAGEVGTLAQNLVDLALERNTDDNASVIAMCIREVSDSRLKSEKKGSNWLSNLFHAINQDGRQGLKWAIML